MAALLVGIGAGALYVGCFMCYKSASFCRQKAMFAHQQDDIFNISGRVQGQTQWPTGDAYLSIEQININHQLNKPDYHDAPPSYEEAMRIAAAGQNSGTSSVEAAIPKQQQSN